MSSLHFVCPCCIQRLQCIAGTLPRWCKAFGMPAASTVCCLPTLLAQAAEAIKEVRRLNQLMAALEAAGQVSRCCRYNNNCSVMSVMLCHHVNAVHDTATSMRLTWHSPQDRLSMSSPFDTCASGSDGVSLASALTPRVMPVLSWRVAMAVTPWQ